MSEQNQHAASGRAVRSLVPDLLADTAACLRFYSRLPIPALRWEANPHALPDFRTTPRMLPVAGAVIGAIGAVPLLLALSLGYGPWLASALCIATLTAVTGAFHEDGLADTADGFGGGATPERRLTIMKDSRIGSFGASALIIALMLRVGALAELGERLPSIGLAASVVIVAALSRTAGLIVLARLPAARPEGSSYAVGQPTPETLAIAWTLLLVLSGALAAMASLPLSGIAIMFVAAWIAGLLITRLSLRLIGGQTGDVAGAIQQLSEIAAMLGLLIVVQP